MPPKTDSSRLILTFVGLYLMYQVDFKDETNLLMIRISYGIIQSLSVGIILFLYTKISKPFQDSTKKISILDDQSKNEEITIQEYDTKEWQKFLKTTLISIGINLFIHFKFEVVPPLLMQSILGISNLMSNPLVQAHILGNEIERPIKEESLFSMFNSVTQPEDDSSNDTKEIEPKNEEIKNEKRKETEKSDDDDKEEENEEEEEEEKVEDDDDSGKEKEAEAEGNKVDEEEDTEKVKENHTFNKVKED
jgi:multisubunit Na+/H+ antiporter MnhC subunit